MCGFSSSRYRQTKGTKYRKIRFGRLNRKYEEEKKEYFRPIRDDHFVKCIYTICLFKTHYLTTYFQVPQSKEQHQISTHIKLFSYDNTRGNTFHYSKLINLNPQVRVISRLILHKPSYTYFSSITQDTIYSRSRT